ncbi:hypothetical protein [Hydrogenoanaerobacterium sp.]|uniref:hypothetical protein n=1 Tax=Hydrogenoanaerobacterium sp. TaxID=2953763 RepID=UPI00289EF72F|nr:hypothetical protein [Hydrogenoanaerobacterium sp.]
MSKLTKFLKLFQYEPEVEKKKTFNITEALNNNWDKIDTELEGWGESGVKYNLGVYEGKTVTIPNTKAGDYLLPSIKGRTLVTKPNPDAEISPDNIATFQSVINPVFTASDGKGNSNTATLQAELYSLPNGVCDEYDGIGGKLTKRIGKSVFLDASGFVYSEMYEDTDFISFLIRISNIKPVQLKAEQNTQSSSHFPLIDGNTAYTSSAEGASVFDSDNRYYISIKKTRLSGWNDNLSKTEKHNKFNDYLKNQTAAGKPVTILYELSVPLITYPNIKLTTYDGITTVSCDNTILQDMSVTVVDQRKVYEAYRSVALGANGNVSAEHLNTETAGVSGIRLKKAGTLPFDFVIQRVKNASDDMLNLFSENTGFDGFHLRMNEATGAAGTKIVTEAGGTAQKARALVYGNVDAILPHSNTVGTWSGVAMVFKKAGYLADDVVIQTGASQSDAENGGKQILQIYQSNTWDGRHNRGFHLEFHKAAAEAGSMIYHTQNITISQSAPTSFLGEGWIHHVY